jgi:hypothetical protein
MREPERPVCKNAPMAREERTAQEIQAEVSRLIHEGRALRDARTRVEVPTPVPRPADGTGLNWWMSGFGNALGYEEAIRVAITEVGKRWNLKP